MDFTCPPEDASGMPRLDMNKGYHFFQYLGPNKTRHVQIMNIDPKLDYMPKTFMDYMMNIILY